MKKKKLKLLTGLLLSLTLLLSEPLSAMAADITPTEEPAITEESRVTGNNSSEADGSMDTEEQTDVSEIEALQSDLSITGTDSLGTMLGSAFSEKADALATNQGCNIFSVEMSGKNATVEYETTRDAALVVAIYEEDGVRLLGTGKTNVEKGSGKATLTISISSMPQYFYLRAYLIKADTLEPLSMEYESPNYTREMQEFFKKTTNDFPAERVLNLDADQSNNFLVYNEKTVRINESAGSDCLVNANESTGSYVFDHISDAFKNLRQGNILAYQKTDGSLLILSVNSIDISEDGTTATVAGSDTTAEEVFDYVKIDTDISPENITVDNSDLVPGVVPIDQNVKNDYFAAGSLTEQLDSAAVGAWDGEGSIETNGSYKLVKGELKDDKGRKVALEGVIGLGLTGTIKYYVSFEYRYLELSLDYKVSGSLKGEASLSLSVPLGHFVMTPFVGVVIEFTPSFVTEIDGSVEAELSFGGKVGKSYDSNSGWTDLSSAPKADVELKAEATLFAGLSFEPEVKIISEYVASAEMEAKVGLKAEFEKSMIPPKQDAEVLHLCSNCLPGTLSVVVEGSVEAGFLNLDRLTVKAEITPVNLKVTDFYYSNDFKEFGFGDCPHQIYRIKVCVSDTSLNPISSAKVHTDHAYIHSGGSFEPVRMVETDENGDGIFYQEPGNHSISVFADGYKEGLEQYPVTDNAMIIPILLDKTDSSGEDDPEKPDDDPEKPDVDPENPDVDPENPDVDPIILSSLEIVSLGENHAGVIKKDKCLYTWGDNWEGQLGNGTSGAGAEKEIKNDEGVAYVTKPTKVMENVEGVSLSADHSLVLKSDGSLWGFGLNNYSQLGVVTEKKWTGEPVLIMDHVKSFSSGGFNGAAIKDDGSLWMWGDNSKGQIGIDSGKTKKATTPVKVLDDAAYVSVENHTTAVIKNDDSLWMCGSNNYGQLGDGTTNDSSSFIKIMDNVKSVCVGDGGYCAAIKKDGGLYMWGTSFQGELGKGSDTDHKVTAYNPIKIMDHVKCVSCRMNNVGAVTEDGSLYMWGTNLKGEIGNGTYGSESVSSPLKIMDHVSIVSVGNHTSAAVKEDGSLMTWGGMNGYGELGNGTRTTGIIDDAIYRKNGTPGQILPAGSIKIPSSSAAASTAAVGADSDDRILLSLCSVGAPSGSQPGSYTDLEPYTAYNFYLLKNRSATDPLAPDNILYLVQAVSDENGTLSVFYIPRETATASDDFVVKMRDYSMSSDSNEDEETPEGLWLTGLGTPVYDGTQQTFDIRLFDGSKQLQEKVDYTLSYKNNKNAYTLKQSDAGFDAKKAPQITVTMKGNYQGKQTVYYKISPLSITDKTVFSASVTGSGKNMKPVLSYCDKALKANTDYTVTDQGNSYLLKGKGNFTGSVSVSKTESEASEVPVVSMSKVKVDAIPNQLYKGSAYTVDDVSALLKDAVSYGDTKLTVNKDYEISKIQNSKNTGTATVVLKGLKDTSGANAYTGEKRIKLSIKPCPVTSEGISITSSDGTKNITASYKKKGATPEPSITFNGTTLKKGRDYVLTYKNNKALGQATAGKNAPLIEITGKGNFTGKESVNFTIVRAEFSQEAGIMVYAPDLVIASNKSKYQTKLRVIDSDGTVLRAGQDYDKNIVYKRNNVVLQPSDTVSVGDEITVEITGCGPNYTSDTISTTYRILAAGMDISKAVIKIKDQEYTGKPIKITAQSQISSAYIGKSKTPLYISTDGGKTGDFMVVDSSYINNVNKGTAKVTLKGINGYGGYLTVTFKIGTRSVTTWWKGSF